MRESTSDQADLELALELIGGALEILRQLHSVQLPHAMTQGQVERLATIDNHGPISLTDLANRVRVKPSVMSRMVGVLNDRGLIRRRRSTADLRGILISTTAKGRSTLQRCKQLSAQRIVEVLGTLSSEETAALVRLARSLKSLHESEAQSALRRMLPPLY